MERLTKPATRHTGNKYVSAIGSGHGAWPRIIQRLAAYENTGLEPEEVAAILESEPLFIPPLKPSEEEELRQLLRDVPPIIVPMSEPSIEIVQHGWVPVTERLPDKEFWEHQKQFEDEDLEVQVMIKGARRPTTLLYNAEGEFYEQHSDGQTFYIVTHWAPLMDPPLEG